MASEKIITKIKNLLDLANNNSNENEAMAAALKAQELMAKYNIDSSAVYDIEKEEKEIAHMMYEDSGKHEMKKWKVSLSTVIARNFCCEVYFYGKSVVFYGYKKDARIAVEVFRFLYEAGNRFAVRYYNKCKKEGKDTRGVMNTYLMGFVAGIKDVLDKQCTALMIIVPEEVKGSFKEMTANWKSKSTNLKMSGDYGAYNQGKTDGRTTATAKEIEG